MTDGKLPNVLLIVIDDLGFSDLGCFGSAIATPHIDRLAREGLRYSNFHVTPSCSPTRASILTGRNPHSVGMGFLSADLPLDEPGYTGRIPRSAGTIAEILRSGGYGTAAFGKWHLAPADERDAEMPHDGWPRDRGFDRYYGFLEGATDQWEPRLVSDDSPVPVPARPEEGYHVTSDLVDHAVGYVRDHAAERPGSPFFVYFAPGAMHIPHQAPRSFIDAYRGRFDHGWDAERERRHERQTADGVVPAGSRLTDRPLRVPAWDDLDERERRVLARQMELYAGFLTHTDAELGRVIQAIEDLGELDDTLVILVSDNGAAGERPVGTLWSGPRTGDRAEIVDMDARLDEFGQPGTSNHYATGWAWASCTPFRMWKNYTWLGGVRVPMIVRRPRSADTGGVRRQMCHAIDLMPTILEIAGIDAPARLGDTVQQPIEGASLVTTFAAAEAEAPRSVQYFELAGSRAIISGRWKATTNHVPMKDLFADRLPEHLTPEQHALLGSLEFDDDRWELFDLVADFTESEDLAERHPEKLRELISLWQGEAERHQVLPMTDTLQRPR